MNRRTALKGGAAAVALVALGLGGAIHFSRNKGSTKSDMISGRWDLVGEGHWLLPGLRDAQMFVPDRPHSKAEAMDAALRAKIKRLRRFSVNSNDWRMRGLRECTDAPAEGVFRIACLGDSVTFGWGVEDHEAWPALVEQRLRDRGVNAEVLNVGVPAQRVEAMCAWIRSAGPRLGLHGVVIAERVEGQRPEQYAKLVRDALLYIAPAKAMLALPPISRFDARGRESYRVEHRRLQESMGRTPVVELTDRLWAAQTETGVDLRVEGDSFVVFRRDTGEVLLEARHQGPDLPASIYALFDEDDSVKEPLFFDEGHPDAEGFHVFADGVVETMDSWFS
ncbi:MAG TPA: hypothetical protein QGF58_02960 [Myxococcota bacterium]|nr:hypothetical protein [Myxococcota bacterium]